jgi:hypothetical protein
MKWLDKTLIVGPYLALCTTEADYKKAMACMGAEEPLAPWLGPNANASTHQLSHAKNGIASIVCIRPDPDRTGVQMASTLIHEAVHVWQQYRDYVGEDRPSSEFEAYAIQNIAETLMEAYAEQVHQDGLAHEVLVRTLRGIYKEADIDLPKQVDPSTEVRRIAKALRGAA